MAAKLLSGKKIAEDMKASLSRRTILIKKRYGRPPALAVIQVGADEAAMIYADSQEKAAREIGIEYRRIKFAKSISRQNLIRRIKELNEDKSVTAIMLGLPLPAKMDLREILCYIDPLKNVERINPTASSVMELIISTGISLYGREAVVVGHGELVGRPIAMSLLDKMATVTVCHIATATKGKLKGHVARAEVLVVAVGKAGIINGEWVKQGSIVIDVGINKVGNKIVGDVEFTSAFRKAGFITPVPGGVGPLTVMVSLRNCVTLFEKQAVSRR